MRICEECYQKVKRYWEIETVGVPMKIIDYCLCCKEEKSGFRGFAEEDINLYVVFSDIIDLRKK